MGFYLCGVLSTGLRAPATNHNNSKMAVASQTAAKTAPAASQGLVKQASQYPLQRSGSARLSRLNSTGKCLSVECLLVSFYLTVYSHCMLATRGVCVCIRYAGVLASQNHMNSKLATDKHSELSHQLHLICACVHVLVYWRVQVQIGDAEIKIPKALLLFYLMFLKHFGKTTLGSLPNLND